MSDNLDTIIANAASTLRQVWSVDEPEWCPFTLTPKQKKFLALPHLEVLYGGAAGGGKTIALAAGALEHVNNPEYHALLLRKTVSDLEKPGSLADVLYDWLSDTGARYNANKKKWRFPSGAQIQLGYIENEKDKYRYKSDNYQYIAFDELTSFEKPAYVYLISRVRRPHGSHIPLRVRSGTNPGDVGAVWVQEHFIPDGFSVDDAKAQMFVEKWGLDGQNQPVLRAFVPALLSDNPGIDQEAYVKSLNQLDPITREQLLKGDWQIKQRGDIYPEWDERWHVITWSQFEERFGSRRIPNNWLLGVGLDWGSTPNHPYVVSFVATAPEGSALAGKVFLYHSISGYEDPPRVVADRIRQHLDEFNAFDRAQIWLMSHEAKSERDTFVMDHGLPFGAWKPDRNAGIAQVRDALQIRGSKPDPFHPELEKDKLGSPNLYLVVADEEMQVPKTDAGLARHRLEFPLYHYAEGSVPYNKKLNDAMDSLRGIAAVFFPGVAGLTANEQLTRKLENFRLEEPQGMLSAEEEYIRALSAEYHRRALFEAEKSAQRSSHWMDEFKRSSLEGD